MGFFLWVFNVAVVFFFQTHYDPSSSILRDDILTGNQKYTVCGFILVSYVMFSVTRWQEILCRLLAFTGGGWGVRDEGVVDVLSPVNH